MAGMSFKAWSGRFSPLFLAGIAAVLTACGPSAASPATDRPTATASSPPVGTTSPTDRARTAAVAAYRGMWDDFVMAAATSDWQSASLGKYATGIALTNMSRGLYADHYNGLVTKGQPVLNPSVSSATPPDNPTRIVVTDCGDSTHWLKYRASNGRLADNTPGGRQLINAIVEKQADGSWKVTDYGVHDVGTC